MDISTLACDKPTVSSKTIAKLLSKRHGYVIDSIRAILNISKPGVFNYTEVFDSRGYTAEFTVCEKLRTLVIERLEGWIRVPMSLREKAALATVEQILGVSLLRQFSVGQYRVDGYDKENNIVYEIDEDHHNFNKEKDTERQSQIEAQLNCKFVRIKV